MIDMPGCFADIRSATSTRAGATHMDNIESVKRKINALIAKAQGTDNEHEALAFMAKATEMLERYQLELWQLGDAGDPVGDDVMFVYRDATPSMNDHHVLSAIAKYYGCRVVRTSRSVANKVGRIVTERSYHIIGRESSRITTQLMFPFIMEQCHEAGKRLAARGHGSASKCTLRVVNSVIIRIHKLTNDATEAAKTPETASRALVVVNELQAYIDNAYGKLQQNRATTIGTTSAARAEAEKVSLHRQTTGASALRIAHNG